MTTLGFCRDMLAYYGEQLVALEAFRKIYPVTNDNLDDSVVGVCHFEHPGGVFGFDPMSSSVWVENGGTREVVTYCSYDAVAAGAGVRTRAPSARAGATKRAAAGSAARRGRCRARRLAAAAAGAGPGDDAIFARTYGPRAARSRVVSRRRATRMDNPQRQQRADGVLHGRRRHICKGMQTATAWRRRRGPFAAVGGAQRAAKPAAVAAATRAADTKQPAAEQSAVAAAGEPAAKRPPPAPPFGTSCAGTPTTQ